MSEKSIAISYRYVLTGYLLGNCHKLIFGGARQSVKLVLRRLRHALSYSLSAADGNIHGM